MEMTMKDNVAALNALFGDTGVRYTDEENAVFEITADVKRNDTATFYIKYEGDDIDNKARLFILNAAELLELSEILHTMAVKLLKNAKDIEEPTPPSKKEYIKQIHFKCIDD